MATTQGCDFSIWQGYNIDFNKVKAAGINFVILRAGYGKYISQKDPTFEGNYKRAKAAGLNVGAYWYSYAGSDPHMTNAQGEADAKQEADVFMQAIKGKTFEMPIYFDLEERTQFNRGAAYCSRITEIFNGALEKAGYFAGLYISRSPLQQYISASTAKKYALWIAEYNSKCNYNGSYGMWQNTSTFRVSGTSGNIDHDFCYVDYPAIIKGGGFNGFPKPKKQEETKKTEVAKVEEKKYEADKPKTESKPTASTEFERGDVNGDGKINVTDLARLAAHIKGKKPLKNK